ncbi:phage major capsid protein [Streptomyces sp. NPDC058206]|uniref:phage major capsid family protein n=1 Tax=Streptomyces sp. NPDC058206 TaxID=3346382 RepID=UPI0036E8311D
MTLADIASDAIARREYAVKQLRNLDRNGKPDTAREAELLATIAATDNAIREAVDNAAAVENQKAHGVAYASPIGTSKRTRDHRAVFGMNLREFGDGEFIAIGGLDNEPVAQTLSAAGKGSRLLPLVNAYPFDKFKGYVPVAPPVTAHVQPRNEADDFLAGLVSAELPEVIKVTAAMSVDNDNFVDVPATEGLLNSSLLAAVGQRSDHVIVNGGTDGDVTVPGLLTDGISTVTTVDAFTAVELFAAVARVQESGADATAIVGNPADIAAVLGAIDGTKVPLLPPFVALPNLEDGTAIVPTGTLIVADLSSVAVGIRRKPEVLKSENSPDAHDRDLTLVAARARLTGPVLPRTDRVQVLKVGA